MKPQALLLVVGIILCGSGLFAQDRYLSLENPDKLKRIKLFPGDLLRYRLKKEKSWHEDEIKGLTYTHFIIGEGDHIKISEVEKISLPRTGTATAVGRTAGNTLIAGGMLFFGLDAVNRAINQKGPVVQQEVGVVTGLMVATGIAITQVLRRKKYRMEKGWQLEIREQPMKVIKE